MAYRPHIVVQYGGRLGTNSGEIWTNSLRFVTSSTDVTDLQGLAEAWGSELSDAVTSIVSLGGYSSAAHLDWIKANAVDASGHQPNTSTNVMYAGEDFAATVGTLPAGPYQNALVITFTTQAARGRASRGRVYVPTGSWTDGSDWDKQTGLMSLSNAELYRDRWAAFLTDLDDNPGVDFANLRAAVVSKLGTDPGNWHAISGVKVGRVIDTQRRRRNALNENYTTVAEVDYA